MVEVHKVSGAAYDGNSYLVMAQHPVLIDAGMVAPPTIRNIRRYIDPERVGQIVLTHCHQDHTAAAPEIQKACGAKIVMPKGGGRPRRDSLATVAYLFGQDAPEFKVDLAVEEGSVLDLGDWKLQVIAHARPLSREASASTSLRIASCSQETPSFPAEMSAGPICSADRPSSSSGRSRG